ncbi:MAG: hypothetical protein JWM16_4117 [Verrucomicrobiales bacterium]|nr:hypothetical protein [Verrucomicrobiales bacterium]
MVGSAKGSGLSRSIRPTDWFYNSGQRERDTCPYSGAEEGRNIEAPYGISHKVLLQSQEDFALV